MLRIFKEWTLPIAMLTGIIGYQLFNRLSFLTPALIFIMLLLTFCKVSPKDLKPTPLHAWLLMIQLGVAPFVYLLLRNVDELLAQAVMVCMICPTATSAAVITGKLGGSAASVSTYTFLANIGVAVVVPMLFPLIQPNPEITFWGLFSIILSKVFVLLICPLLAAWLIQKSLPSLHRKLTSVPDLAFYLWAFALAIVTSQIVVSMLEYSSGWQTATWIAVATFITCCLQFFIGKSLGSVYNDRISGGQSLGQKNTILAIWMTHAYLNPVAAIGPGFYVLWQNMVNSWQLWKKRKEQTL